jgi:hypothetical protein
MPDSIDARAGTTPSRQAAWLETGRLRGEVAE